MNGRGLVLLVGLALACGRKTPPLAPELVRPEPPGELAAASTPGGVRLGWLRPERYSGGLKMNDLDRFLIERAPGDGTAPQFVQVGVLQLTDRYRFRKERHLEWTDTDVTAGARYLYRVTAMTLDGSESTAGPIAVRFEPPQESR